MSKMYSSVNNKNIVIGEASETDSEDESNSQIKVHKELSLLNSNVVAGEDVESDQEDDKQIFRPGDNTIAVEATESYPSEKSTPTHSRDGDNNIVRHHINQQCANILNEFIKTTATLASKQLIETDQLLMKTQVSLQNSATVIKKVHGNAGQVSEKLNDVLSSNFIPQLRIPKL